MSKAVALGAIALYPFKGVGFLKRLVCAAPYAATDGRVPKRLLGFAALGLLPLPGLFDEIVLLVAAVPLVVFYWGPLADGWRGTVGGLDSGGRSMKSSRGCWTILGAACMILTVSACGGSDASKTEIVRLKSTPPISFVRVSGPAGAVNYIAGRLAAATFKKDQVGVFFAPSHYPRPRCSFSHTIRSTDARDLQQWRGKKVRIAVYDSAGLFCQVLRLYIFRTAAGAG
jgi:hypothetical protein